MNLHRIAGIEIAHDAPLIAGAERAERKLIACGVPVARRVGVIAYWTIAADEDKPAEFVTIRRYADDWRLISTMTTTTIDGEGDGFLIGMPPEDLKAIRAGGDDLEDFEIYIEARVVSRSGQPVFINAAMPHRFHEFKPTRDYIDAWKPMSAAERAEFAAAMAEHQAILEIRD